MKIFARIPVVHDPDLESVVASSYKLKSIEPCHEIMVFLIPHKLILQKCMQSHPVVLDVWFLVGPFASILHVCEQWKLWQDWAGLPEPLLVTYVIRTIISWAGSNTFWTGKHMSRAMRKCVSCHMRTTKVQISLHVRAVWSAPLLFAT